jgi:para-aminobenzoate synthetase/4-amino-4-deoxychorismate lyase
MVELAVLYDSQSGQWLRFSSPLEVLETHTIDKVLPILEYIEERVEREGLCAAGFLSYEAAEAFDDALQVKASGDFPLLHFGLFSAAEHIELPPPDRLYEIPNWQVLESISNFSSKVDKIRNAIARGDTYQVNLTFPLYSEFSQDSWPFFLQLVHRQQAGGAGYLRTKRWDICSASPELFFSRDGDLLCMRPMKGTAPRGLTLAEDRRRAEELLQSPKNRAENIMILDMVRNDLGRLASPGEVWVKNLCVLEKYPTVWQLTSTAVAFSNSSLAEVFQALFPCASVTGAPKAKSMHIISETEAWPRQIYTGTFGWIAPGRQARFNVAIRTVLIDKQLRRASYGVGAGITWDSDNSEEYRECLDKAAVLARPRESFSLIETLRWTPVKGYFLLPEHLARLQASAEYFDFACNTDRIVTWLHSFAKTFTGNPQRVRLVLHQNGEVDGTFSYLAPAENALLRIRLAAHPVQSEDLRLYHKTTLRRLYETYRDETADADEVVLWNQHNEVTECCTANLVIEKNGRLLTPPLSSGLLPGTYREFLLRRRVIEEQIICKDDLRKSPRIFLINAVHKWRRAMLCQ